MRDCKVIERFVQPLFERKEWGEKMARMIAALWRVRSARVSEIARGMDGAAGARYKEIQRFLRQVELKAILVRLFAAEARFVLGDVTEIARLQARRTEYVGTLKDGKSRGFWLLTLAVPFRGRAIPFSFVIYSSKTLRQEATSRNQHHWAAFGRVRHLFGERPLVLDREFSYLELLHNLVAEGVHFVIRLNLGSHPPLVCDRRGRRIDLLVSQGEEQVHTGVLYQGQVRVNLIGRWERGLREPLWIMTDLAPHQGWQLYQQRMKIEECFRDLKSLLGLHKLMNKTQHNLEQMIALVLLAYAIGVLLGETLRDHLYAHRPSVRAIYSGLFILLKDPAAVGPQLMKRATHQAVHLFQSLLHYPVPTHV